MKSKKSFLTNLIIFALVLAVCTSFFACSSDSSDSSVPYVSDNSDNGNRLTVEVALGLINADKAVIERFVCNSLCGAEPTAAPVALDEGHDLRDFAKVRDMLSSVYSASGGQSDAFLAYPLEAVPAIGNVDGVTHVFYHSGSGFDDFIAPDSVTVLTTDSEDKALIKAKTSSGREVELTAVYESDKWLLEKSLFSVIPVDNSCDKTFPLSGKGSLAGFTGEVLVISFFVEDNNYKFADEEELEFNSRIASAVDYLVSETERYGGNVNVTYENAYFEHAGNIGNGDLPFDIVFSETGFGTLKKFAEHKFDLTQYDNYFFAVCFNKDCDELYKPNDGGATTEIYYAERLFVGKNTTDSAISRMVLSLSGAYDYRSGVCDEYTESLYRTYFPYDVMAGGSLDSSSVTPVTAYCCGMVNELSKLYYPFIYSQDNQEQSEEQ